MEEWKVFGRYAVSSFGRVKSVGTERPTLIKLQKDQKGYLRYCFYEGGKNKTIRVHILVWDLFGDKPRNNMHIDHIDENKENNHISNLQLLTPRENFYKTRMNKRQKYSSKYVGVSLDNGKWVARKKIDGVYKSLGRFLTQEEAYNAYQASGVIRKKQRVMIIQ